MSERGRRHVHFEGADWQRSQAARHQAPQAAPWRPVSAPSTEPQLSLEQARDQLSNAEDDLSRRVAGLRGRFAALETALAEAVATGPTRDKLAVEEAETNARELQARLMTQADQDMSRRIATAQSRLTELSQNLAPGWAGASWGDLAQEATAAIPADHVRVGSLAISDDWHVPAVVPFIEHSGLYIDDTKTQEQLALAIASRVLAQTPLKHVSVHVFDPRMRGIFGPLMPLRAAHASAFPQPSADASAFTERMQQVLQSAARNVELARAEGAPTLTGLWRHRGTPEGILHLVVILDYPYGVDQQLQEKLLRLAVIGGRSGVNLLVCGDSSAQAAREVEPTALAAELFRIEVGDHGLLVPGYPRPVVPELRPPAELMQQLTRALVAESKTAKGPVISLSSLISDDLTQPWQGDSAESLDAVIGQTGRELLTLSLRTENPPHPNLLIGGAVGQGKSNLLLDIIYALAARYDPDQLELHLLDFKRGLEFKRFAPDTNGQNWLPHVKVLSLESNQAFGVAVLRHVDREMAARAQLFKDAGANSLNKYRELSGAVMPRLLLAIDEFHVLFEGEERYVEEAVELLDRLAKQGRAYGVHLLLASQTTSGVRGLAVKGDSIYAQFPLRLSLKNTPQESEAILSQGNKAAADLTYRGEVILNSNFGTDPEGSNVRGLAAYADPDDMMKLQEQLWQRGHGGPPLVFVGSDHAPWDPASADLPTLSDGQLRLMVGRPIEITSTPWIIDMQADSDQTVAVVGQSQSLAGDTLNALVRSAAPQLAAQDGSIVILDGFAAGEHPWLDQLELDLRRAGLRTQRIARDRIAGWLTTDLAARLRAGSGSAMLVVGVGLQRAREMDARPSTPESDDFDFGGFGFESDDGTGRSVLRDLASSGALSSVYFVGWWSNLRSLEADLGIGHSGVAQYLTIGVGRDDLRTVAGVNTPPIDGAPRVGFFDRNGEEGLRVLVPFDSGQRFTGDIL